MGQYSTLFILHVPTCRSNVIDSENQTMGQYSTLFILHVPTCRSNFIDSENQTLGRVLKQSYRSKSEIKLSCNQ